MRKRSFPLGPALIGSLLLHVAVIGVLVFEFPREAGRLVLSAVPVDIISQEQHEAAPAPETQPQPAPTPEPPAPQPQPQPQPQPPSPEPPQKSKAAEKPQPSDKPTQAKPQPRQDKPSDDNFLEKLAGGGSPRYASSQPNRTPRNRPGQGQDAVSTGPDVDALRGMFGRLWSPNCPAPGAENIQVGVHIHLRYDGSTTGPAEIDNPHPGDRAWDAAAERAAIAAKAIHYRDLTPAQLRTLADRGEIYFKIDQRTACRQ